MNAISAGGRTAVKEASEIGIQPLEDTNIIQSLTSMRDMFLTSLGPRGYGKLLHNDCGGPVVITASSSRLLQGMSTSKPIVRLIHSALQDHLKVHADGGSLTAVLSLQLILKAIDLKIHRRLVIDTYSVLLGVCVEYLESSDCPFKRQINFGDPAQLLLFIRTMYTSKLTCLLYDDDLDHVCQLTLNTYLQTFMNNAKGLHASDSRVLYVASPGRGVQLSKIYNGLLFQAPQIPTYRSSPVQLRRTPGGHIAVALVETSMAGDSDSYLDVTYETPSNVNLSDVTLDGLVKFSEAVDRAGVGLVACQRVVHPTVKKALKQRGILCLDRLGQIHFTALHRLAGGDVLHPFSAEPVHTKSMLSDVHHLILCSKSYVQLLGVESDGEAIHTVSLCHRTEEALTEIKEIFQTCQHLLRLLCRQPDVLCGASCWQTCLTYHLKCQALHLTRRFVDTLGCSDLQFGQILRTLISSLLTAATMRARTNGTVGVVDRASGHHFMLSDGATAQGRGVTCQCGSVGYKNFDDIEYHLLENMETFDHTNTYTDSMEHRETRRGLVDVSKCTIQDVYLSNIGVLKTAIGITSMVLGIHNYVQDIN